MRLAVGWVVRRALIVLGSLIGLVLCVYLLRSPIATAAFAQMIDRRQGLRCSHPEIEVGASLDTIVVAPIECNVAEGPLASAQTFTATTIDLDGTTPKSVRAVAAVVNFRERDISNVEQNTLADLGDIAGMSSQLIKGMLDGAETYSNDTPNMSIRKLTQLRAGKKEGVLHDYVATRDGEWNRRQARVVENPSQGVAEVRDFDMRVTRARGRLTMNIYLGAAERGEAPDMQLRMLGEGLDGPKPRIEMSLASPGGDRSAQGRDLQTQRASEANAGREHSTSAATRPAREAGDPGPKRHDAADRAREPDPEPRERDAARAVRRH